jgi:hypothetical protein
MTPNPIPYDELAGYREHFNPDDAEAVMGEVCPICAEVMAYRGFKNQRQGSMRAFAECTNPHCRHSQEF